MENFTPYSALAGGVLIGIASAMLLLLNGRIAGISGIVGGILRPQPGEVSWRAAFIVGLLAGPVLYQLATGATIAYEITTSIPLLIAAGLLVGYGTRLGSGCTSGHGVCGMGRLSRRGIVATLVFMAVAVVTTFISRHVVGL